MATVITLLQMTAENSGSAGLDRSHDTALRYREPNAVLLTIGLPVATKYIRYFQLGAIHLPAALEVLWYGGGWVNSKPPRGENKEGLFGGHPCGCGAPIASRGS